MKTAIALLLIILTSSFFSFKARDVVEESYVLKGKIFFNNKPVRSDSLKFVFHYPGQKVSPYNIKIIHTDSDGKYSVEVRWIIPCMSGGGFEEYCKNLSRKDCYRKEAKPLNPDSLGFVYGQKEIMIYNRYWELYEQHRITGTIIEQDINF